MVGSTEKERVGEKMKGRSEDMAVYHEDGWVAEVEIVSDTSDAKWDRKTLRVVRTLRNNSILKTPPDGKVFDVEKRKNVGGFPGLWYLDECE